MHAGCAHAAEVACALTPIPITYGFKLFYYCLIIDAVRSRILIKARVRAYGANRSDWRTERTRRAHTHLAGEPLCRPQVLGIGHRLHLSITWILIQLLTSERTALFEHLYNIYSVNLLLYNVSWR